MNNITNDLEELRDRQHGINVCRHANGLCGLTIDAAGQDWGLEYRLLKGEQVLVRGTKEQVLAYVRSNAPELYR